MDVTGWDTVPSLVSQGLLQEIPDASMIGEPLWDKFPHKDDLEAEGVFTVQQAYWLTDKELEDLAGIGEVGVEKIRQAVAIFRGENWPPEGPKLEDVLSEDELELLRIARGEQDIKIVPPTDTATEGITVGGALKGVIEALDKANFLELRLTRDELYMLRLSREEIDPGAILAELEFAEGMYTLSKPLQTLLDRLNAHLHLPDEPPAPQEPSKPDEAPQHPTTDEEPASDDQLAAQGAGDPPAEDPPADEAPKGKKRKPAKP